MWQTQIGKILKNKDGVLASYEANAPGTRVHTQSRSSEYAEVNSLLYERYMLACSKNIHPGGPQLTEKAREIASHLGRPNFKGSNGWLQKWKVRYNIKEVTVSGESGDVRLDTVESWKERLPELLRGYRKEDIWNFDETGCFWKALPDRGFGQKGKECKGGKKCKQRLTVALMASAAGETETPVVIGMSERPRCFKGVDKSHLPVKYFHQKKAWMSSQILDQVLSAFNQTMKAKDRSILLLMDNAGCHPVYLKDKYSNIKTVYLPPNTTSKLQPLDLGIIQNFKVHYRHLLLRFVLAKIEECSTASDVVKSVNLLMAIRWVARAWNTVSPDTISRCFRKAGVLDSGMGVVDRGIEEEVDPFDDLDADHQVRDLISQTMPAEDRCTVEEYINGEDGGVPVCSEFDKDTWDDTFLEEIGEPSQISDNEEGEDDEGLEIPSPKIKSFKEAIPALEEVRNFLDSRSCPQDATMAAMLIDNLATQHASSAKQTSLLSYFKPQ